MAKSFSERKGLLGQMLARKGPRPSGGNKSKSPAAGLDGVGNIDSCSGVNRLLYTLFCEERCKLF